MSNLRLFGLFLSLVMLYFIIQYYRARRQKTPLTVGILAALSLALVSYTPDTFNTFFNTLTRTQNQYYRIIILLIIGIVFLFLLLLRNLFVSESHESAFDELTVRHALKEFENAYGAGEIEPIQIIIPAYNEAENLKSLLPKLPDTIRGTPVNAFVVSDGSDDATVEVARENGYPVVENLVNRGGGLSLNVGFEIAERGGAETIVTMDADGQHDPADLASLLEPVLDRQADLVVGSRRLGESHQSSFLRHIGVVIFNRLISILMNETITDCSNGYRAFDTSLLSKLTLRENRYHTTEFLIQALGAGARYREVPVTVHQRSHGTSKKGPDLFYGFRFFRVLFRTWWWN